MKIENVNVDSNIKAIIEEDLAAGFYLYIYDLTTGECIRDHLQDTLTFAKEQAEEDYGLPLDGWKPY